MTRLTADLCLLFAALVWGIAFLFQKQAMADIGPLTFVAARAGLAALALLPFALREHQARGRATVPMSFWSIATLSGAAFFAGAILQQMGLITASVTNTGFLTALYVVITPFIAWTTARVAPSRFVWPAVGLSAAGTWLLGGGTLSAFSAGDGLVALSAVFWAAHVVIVGQAGRHSRPVAFTAVQFLVVAVLALLGALVFESTTPQRLYAALPSILYVGLMSSALTFTLLTMALQHTPPSEAAVIVSLETVFAAIAAFVVLGERLPLIAWVGAAMIMAGTLVIQLGGARHAPAKAD